MEEFKPACRPPRFIGDVYGKQSEGEEALTGLRFHEDAQGLLWVWALPEEDEEVEVTDRYLLLSMSEVEQKSRLVGYSCF